MLDTKLAADKTPPMLDGSLSRCASSHEGVEDNITGATACSNDMFHHCQRLFAGVLTWIELNRLTHPGICVPIASVQVEVTPNGL